MPVHLRVRALGAVGHVLPCPPEGSDLRLSLGGPVSKAQKVEKTLFLGLLGPFSLPSLEEWEFWSMRGKNIL